MPLHCVSSGDCILLKTYKNLPSEGQLQPKWNVPYEVLLDNWDYTGLGGEGADISK